MSSLKVYSGNEQCTQLIFRCAQSPDYFLIESSVNLVESVFQRLDTLLFSDVVALSTQSLLGVLVSNCESMDHLCSVIPLAELGLMCERALSVNDMKTFLQICLCSIPDIALFECNDTEGSKKRVDSSSVRLPASLIWSLLVLSEYFNVSPVFQQCKKQLLQKLLLVLPSSDSSTVSEGLFSVIADKSVLPSLTQSLNIHLLKFGPRLIESESSPTAVTQNPAAGVAHPPVDNAAAAAVSATSPIPAYVGPPLDVSTPHHRQHRPSDAGVAPAPVASSIFDDDGPSAHKHRSVLHHQESVPQQPSTPPRPDNASSSSAAPHSYSPSPIPHKLLLSSSMTPSERPWPEEHLVSSYTTPPMMHTHNGSSHQSASSRGNRRSVSPLGRSVSPTAMQSRRLSTNAHPAAASSGATPGRSISPSTVARMNPPMVHGLHSSHSLLTSSPPTEEQQQQVMYNEDQLRLSREVARLRLSEVRVRDEWLRLQQLGEKNLRENRLRTLQLQAEVARYQSVSTPSSHDKEYLVSTNPHSQNKLVLKTDGHGRSSGLEGNKQQTRQQVPHSTPPGAVPLSSAGDREIRDIYRSVASNGRVNVTPTAAAHSSSSARSGGGGAGAAAPRPSSAPPTRPVGQNSKGNAEVSSRDLLTSNEARHRAALRIRQRRQQDKEKEKETRTSLTETQAKLFQQRDEKIARFKERQLLSSTEPYITSPDPHTPLRRPAGAAPKHVNGSSSGSSRSSRGVSSGGKKYSPLPGDRFDLQPLTDNEGEEDKYDEYEESGYQRSSRVPLYSQEALRAVGQGLSPNSASATTPHRRQPAKHRYSDVDSSPPDAHYVSIHNTTAASFTTDSSGGSVMSSPDVFSTPFSAGTAAAVSGRPSATQQKVLTIVVLRATDLVECLGSTSAYVTFDWGRQYGKNSTQCVRDSCNPTYNSILKFRMPNLDFSRLNQSAEVDVPPVKVLVFNRRESVSDELIAQGELDIIGIIKTNLLTNNRQYNADIHTLCLTDAFKEFAGYIDVSIDY